jgi:hypothetical protein
MNIYPTNFRGLSEHAINPGEQVTNPGAHATYPDGRGTVSRAWVVMTFLLAKILTGMNAPFQSGLRVPGGRQNSTIERTVPIRAYGRWTMFEKIFQHLIGVFAVRFTQPVGRGLVLVPAIAFPRELMKPKPATNALNLVKPMTGGGGLGEYAKVMKRKRA